MSYCVNCGVKLEQSLKNCPLCHTPVFNPNEISSESNSLHPFAMSKGEVEPLKKHDVGLWLTIVLGSTAITCGILNFGIFNLNYWSIPVIGACMVLWLFFCPRMFFHKIPVSLNLLAGGISVIFYELSITMMTKSDRWFYELCLPITLVLLGLITVSAFFYKYVSRSLLVTVLYFFIDVGILCISIEFFIDKFIAKEVHLLWSAIVFSVCTVICAGLIAILSIARLRETVRKRFHF